MESRSRGERVLALDRQPVWLRAVESIVGAAGFDVQATSSVEEALAALDRERPDVLMLGVDDEPDAERLLERVRERAAETKLVVVAADDDLRAVERALEIGADAYVVKRAQPHDLVFVVRQVLSPEVYEVRPAGGDESQRVPDAEPAGLTPREQDILRLVALGRSNAEVGRLLSISERTVKGHLWRLYRKLGVSTRTAAAQWARSQLPDGE